MFQRHARFVEVAKKIDEEYSNIENQPGPLQHFLLTAT